MNKKISSNLFMLALCMQYGAVTVEAVQGTLKETYIAPAQKNELTRRLLIVENKLSAFDDKLSALSEQQLEMHKNQLDQIVDVLAEKEKNDFEDSSLSQKRAYVLKKIKSVIKDLRGNKLSDKYVNKVSDKIDVMEKALSSGSKSSRSKK